MTRPFPAVASSCHHQDAGRRFGLDWPLLAAVGRVESDHGRLTSDCRPSAAGAIGPMQFLPASFAQASAWAGLSDADICDPADAIPAAAVYLRHFGAPDDWRRALDAYHPADAYVDLVLAWAQRYGYAATVVWPLDGPISQRFGPTDFELEPALWYRGGWYRHFHTGLDIAAPGGTPVRAIAAGVITFAGTSSRPTSKPTCPARLLTVWSFDTPNRARRLSSVNNVSGKYS